MKISLLSATLALACLPGLQSSAQAAVASFDDWPTTLATDQQTGLFFANGNSSLYAGAVWDARFSVVGDAYRVAPTATPPGPLFGIPRSGHYFVTNQGNDNDDDGLRITTTQVLLGAWFGQNEYYGYGGGADQITIHAMGASGVLGSVVFDLPELRAGGPAVSPGEPELLELVDTSSFAALTGITGYRIDRRPGDPLTMPHPNRTSWVADDFTFAAAPVPEPETYAMLLAGLGLVAWARSRRTA